MTDAAKIPEYICHSCYPPVYKGLANSIVGYIYQAINGWNGTGLWCGYCGGRANFKLFTYKRILLR